ncbi:TPA: hypothetical protein N0F65_010176 [Lagenidium giganteum]|uniref:Large ribosomal subunit protein uL24c n=1 Tax=Lagenidium giganteum TaxID=4803 RepID=A0AAV2Z353_9STRA|nr:TPA: hypothetical protein N0F65_010176 [Lagenidium giganteum]
MATRIPIAFRRGPRRKEKAIELVKNWNIVRGDLVEVISGPHKGKQGHVTGVIRDQNRVIVENINMHHRYVKATAAAPGRSYLAPGPIHYSSVNLVDPSLGKPTRVAIRYLDNGEKVRVSKKSGTIIPKPEALKERQTPRRTETGIFDTAPEDVLERTVPEWEITRLLTMATVTNLALGEESQPLTTDDQKYFDAVKEQYGDVITEDFGIRVARAFRAQKKNRMQVTINETKRILEWRKQFQVDSILTRELEQSKVYFDCWPGSIYGEDNNGHLITVDRISEIQLEAFQKNFGHIDQLLPHRAQYMERVQWEKVAISKRMGRRVYKHICIVDLKGLGMKHCGPSVIQHLKPIFDVGQLYYPETLHRLYLVNAPMVFYGVWKVIGSLIDPETREKIQVFKELDKFLDEAQKHALHLQTSASRMSTDVENEEGQPISAEDQPFYDALVAEFGDRCTEDFRIRVTRAFRAEKKNRLEVTVSEAKRILEFRERMEIDTILTRELDQTKLFNDCWPGFIYGEDAKGHLISVIRISEIQIEALQKNFADVQLIIPHRLQYMERIQWEKAAISKRLGRRVYKHIVVVDLGGVGMKHLSPSVVSQLKPIFDLSQLYYPETLFRLYLINVPMVFYGVWKLIQSFIKVEVREKIVVMKDTAAFMKEIQSKGVTLDALPMYLGGEHRGRAMNNTFKPSIPDIPPPVPPPAQPQPNPAES